METDFKNGKEKKTMINYRRLTLRIALSYICISNHSVLIASSAEPGTEPFFFFFFFFSLRSMERWNDEATSRIGSSVEINTRAISHPLTNG